jgi:hypothetical protein
MFNMVNNGLAKTLVEALEIKEDDSTKVANWKAFGQGALDGAVVVGTFCAVAGLFTIIGKLKK